jgi:ATP-binding cassette subfamily F protein uup
MDATAQEGGGSLVVAAEGVTKSLGGRALVRDFSTRVMRGDRIGIVGPNGAGKTTLLNLLTGALAPDAGEVRLGTGLGMVTLDQKREALDPNATLAATLTGGTGDVVHLPSGPRHVHGYMQDFLFPAEQARTPVSALSGGERARLLLARALARPANLLVLDEPTNDLDVETLDLLEELLATHPGTVLVVSHDRDFLDRVATGVIAWEGEGLWRDYAGGYSDMAAQRGGGVVAREAAAAPRAARREAAPAPAPRRKLGFKESHALATLPARMEQFTAEIARHQAALADPGLYARDAARFAQLSAALASAEAALAEAEEEWLRLELLREAIESGNA